MKRLAALLLCLPLLAQAESVLRYCAAGSPKTFDPAMTDSGVDHVASIQIYANLIDVRRGTDELIPALAERWSVSPDGLAYTFDLRANVAFHSTDYFKPTRLFDADDVLFSFGRLLSRTSGPGSDFARALPGVSPYVASFGWEKLITGVEKLSPRQVRITLAERDASFLSALSFAFAGMHSAEYGAQLLKAGTPARIAQAPVGAGPFAFKSYRLDSVLRLVKHPAWFRKDERARADQLVFAITPDANVRAQRLKRDECDLAAPVSPSELAELRRDPAMRIASAPGLNVGFLSYNTRRPALAKLEVRQALDMAIDKAAILRAVFGETGVLAHSTIPAASWAHDDSLRSAPFNPEKARELLKKAGVLPLKLDLWALPVVRPYNPNGQLTAQMIQADWAKVGVGARIVTYELGEYWRRISAGDHDVALAGWNGDPEPANTAGQLVCGADSGSFWCEPRYDQLVAEARAGQTREARKAAYVKAQRLAMAQLPWSPLAHGAIAVPLRAAVKGFVLDLDGGMFFDGVLPR